MCKKILSVFILFPIICMGMKGPDLKDLSENQSINRNCLGVIKIADENSVHYLDNNEVEFSSRVSLCFLINEFTVVTTAHTVEKFSEKNINSSRSFCVFNLYNEKPFLISNILRHPLYYSHNVDLALIFLKSPCLISKYIEFENNESFDLSVIESITIGLNKKDNEIISTNKIVWANLHYTAINSASTSLPMPPDFFIASQYILPVHIPFFLKDKNSYIYNTHGQFFMGDVFYTEPMDSGGPIINVSTGKIIGINIKGLKTAYAIIDNNICILDNQNDLNTHTTNKNLFYSHKAVGLFIFPYLKWIEDNKK